MPDTHEFIPETALSKIGEGSLEARKRGLVAIDSSVRKFIQSLNSNSITPEERDSMLNNTVKTFLEFVKYKFLDQPDPNLRIGGLMAMACTALSLEKYLLDFCEKFIKLVILSFYDQDNKVRYYSCEALYNIVKKCKVESISCISEIFDGICKLTCDIDEDVKYASQILNRLLCDTILEFEDVPLDLITDILANRILVLNPQIRQLIVIIQHFILLKENNFIIEIDMLEYLPKVFLGIANMLTDNNNKILYRDVRSSAEMCLNDFLIKFKKKYSKSNMIKEDFFKIILLNCKRSEHVIKLLNIVWIREICAIQPQIIHFKGFFLLMDFIISQLSDPSEELNKIATEANHLLYRNVSEVKSISYIEKILKVLVDKLVDTQNEQVILSILDWFSLILQICPEKMDPMSETLSKSVIQCFKHPQSQMIMESTLRTTFLLISLGDSHLELLAGDLLNLFKTEKKLLEDSGREIVLNLCKQLGFERFYTIITNSMKLSTEAQEFRTELLTPEKSNLSEQLLEIWSHNLSSALSFSLFIEKYDLAQDLLQKISGMNLKLDLLVKLDQIVQLMDTHIYSRLRLHLLKPDVYPSLLNTLLGNSD
ncbi:Tax1-binding protein TRX-like protein, putative [Theileria annulata]|uniref:Tax1-binding protein TRX-like protein, putative n=1 Tax=Theileria annulata TaxID=5874 RepID=Q4UF45_THEAN|nr:Tax1-binding protein TRX-like protein, putative [Theileria annulata]CAI74294.1 Tax1-binding protein TRX-like protein, putative [Theileria annulata]|eukprot:XP_952026.1 Tax1-binding protein TRX-like protein, putative [Theileria annulata]